jgi:branched-subunit amino acid transport protein AzlD
MLFVIIIIIIIIIITTVLFLSGSLPFIILQHYNHMS